MIGINKNENSINWVHVTRFGVLLVIFQDNVRELHTQYFKNFIIILCSISTYPLILECSISTSHS